MRATFRQKIETPIIEIEGENWTEGEETGRQLMYGKEIRPGTQMLATHSYMKNGFWMVQWEMSWI